MKNQLIYLSTNILQKDMRIRLPKSILSNLDLVAGETALQIFIDKENDTIVLRAMRNEELESRKENV